MFFVRSAHEGDLARVSALLGETWHQTYDALIGAASVSAITAEWHSVAALKARMAAPASEFVVADDGRTIGGAGYAAMDRTSAKTAVLHFLYVLPSAQRGGVGRDLFAELETCFPDAETMRVEVAKANHDAIRFYERLGFLPVGENKASLPGGAVLDHLVMEKPLAF